VTARVRGTLLVVLAVLLSACTLDLDVNVAVQPDGSGSVEVTATLDAGALQRIGGDLSSVLDLDGLRADGWTVDGPTPTDDGGVTVHLRQPFDSPEQADEVFADLAGPGTSSPFRGLHVERDSSTFRTRWRFGGAVDLDRGVSLPGVTPSADGQPLPTDLQGLEDRLGESLDRLLRLRIGVRLPGSVRSNATTKADNGAVWLVRFGDGRLDLDATGTRTRTSSYVLVGLGALLVLVGIVALLVRLAGRVTARGGPPGSVPR
jgi:hypothetical protein